MNDVAKLVLDHKRLIESEATKYAQFVPLYVAQAEAYKLARVAAEKYDPGTGLQFSTYLTNSLKKLSRLSTEHGGNIRLPEDKQFKLQKVNVAETSLKSDLGRDPTLHELSIASGFNLPTLTSLLQARRKDVNINNLAYAPIFIDNENDDWVHFVYHDLTDRDKYIFEHKTGFGGKARMSNEEIGKNLNISPSTVANRIKLISDRVSEGTNFDTD